MREYLNLEASDSAPLEEPCRLADALAEVLHRYQIQPILAPRGRHSGPPQSIADYEGRLAPAFAADVGMHWPS